MKKPFVSIITLIALMGTMSFNVNAMSTKHRDALEWSGCTQVTEGNGCDINKPKAWNLKHSSAAVAPAPRHDHVTPPPSTSYRSEMTAFMEDSVLGQKTDAAYEALAGYGFSNNEPGVWVKGRTVVRLQIRNDRVIAGQVKL